MNKKYKMGQLKNIIQRYDLKRGNQNKCNISDIFHLLHL